MPLLEKRLDTYRYNCPEKIDRINLLGNYMNRKLVYLAVGRNGAPQGLCQ